MLVHVAHVVAPAAFRALQASDCPRPSQVYLGSSGEDWTVMPVGFGGGYQLAGEDKPLTKCLGEVAQAVDAELGEG